MEGGCSQKENDKTRQKSVSPSSLCYQRCARRISLSDISTDIILQQYCYFQI